MMCFEGAHKFNVQMRSSKNFCIDVALICVILAMALWIYNLFKK